MRCSLDAHLEDDGVDDVDDGFLGFAGRVFEFPEAFEEVGVADGLPVGLGAEDEVIERHAEESGEDDDLFHGGRKGTGHFK